MADRTADAFHRLIMIGIDWIENALVGQQGQRIAFEFGVTDIISFDYWHSELEEVKSDALLKAMNVARNKSKVLLDPELFEMRPKLINLQEESQTIFPAQMYESYSNTIEQVVVLPYRYKENVPRISAPRPQTTFYRGPVVDGEALSPHLPMKPEISVVSRVSLYFESPHEDTDEAGD